MGEAQSGVKEDKKGTGGLKGVGEREYSKTILLLFRARAGSTRYIFFLLV
jgi:hypothetical protein